MHGTVAAGYEGVREEFANVVAGEREDYAGQPLLAGIRGGRQAGHHAAGGARAPRGGSRRGCGFSLAELADDRLIAARMAGQRPYWRPGAAFGYHAGVIGALTGEVVRRTTGRSIQELFEERVRAPYGLDFYLGLPEELEPRFATTLPMLPTPEQQAEIDAEVSAVESLGGIAFNEHRPDAPELWDFPNHRIARAQGQASAGGVASARAWPACTRRPPQGWAAGHRC